MPIKCFLAVFFPFVGARVIAFFHAFSWCCLRFLSSKVEQMMESVKGDSSALGDLLLQARSKGITNVTIERVGYCFNNRFEWWTAAAIVPRYCKRLIATSAIR